MLKAQDGPRPVTSGWRANRTVVRHLTGLLSAALTTVVLLWQLSVPALWLDESASVIATQRSWGKLWVLFQGPDAPLVPYYALLKLLTGLVLAVDGHATSVPEVLYRWPSVLAEVIAVWVLTVGLARLCSTPLLLTITALLLGIGGISRYGQEARPYGFVVLFAVVSTVCWLRMVTDGGRRWVALYAVSVALLATSNTLAISLVAAHLVADLIAVQGGKRRAALVRTVAAAAAGLTAVSVLVVNAAIRGAGATYYLTTTPGHLLRTYVDLFTVTKGHSPTTLSTILLLALLGLIQTLLPKHRFIARVAACWAIVPTLVLTGAVLLRPNLLIGRYFLFTVPAWAILAALGVFTIAQDIPVLIVSAYRRYGQTTASRAPTSPREGRVVRLTGAAAAGVIVVAVLSLQLSTLKQVREPGGHSENMRPALVDVQAGNVAELPILVTSRLGSLGFASYDRKDERRFVGWTAQRTTRDIWPTRESAVAKDQQLSAASSIILLERATSVDCGIHPNPSAAYARRCIGSLYTTFKYHPIVVRPAGEKWWFLILAKRGNT